jgi:acetoin utilization deacetylase AcuC-like enzyme
MTDYNPFDTMFEMQRTVLDQQHQFVTRSMDMQRRMLESMTSSTDVGRNMDAQTRHMAEAAMDATMETMERATPGGMPAMDDIRDMIDQQLEAGESMSEETWTAIESQLEETLSTYESMLDQGEQVYEDLFEAYMDTFERVEESVEEAA